MNNQFKGAILTLSAGISWGLSGSIGQYLFTTQGMDARWLTPIRLFCAGLIFFFYCFFSCRERLFAVWKSPRSAFLQLCYGLAGVTLCQYSYFRTIQLSSAGTATILHEFSPTIILICTCIAARRRPRIREVVSILLAFLGIFLIVTHGDVHSIAISPHALAMGLTCAGSIALYNLLAPGLSKDFPISVMQAWSFLPGGILLAFVFHFWTYAYTPGLIGVLGICCVVALGNVIAFSLYMSGIRLIGPNRGILYGFSEPVTAAIISTALLGSPFTLYDAIGFACVFAMLVLISISREGK